MKNNNFDFNKFVATGYNNFKQKYASGDQELIKRLGYEGQKPKIMVIACSDSRADPAILLQCNPGDLFVVRNVANIMPPCEVDNKHHGTSAALEFAVNFLQVEHIVLLGHSDCGGIKALLGNPAAQKSDFILPWVNILADNEIQDFDHNKPDNYAKLALHQSYNNCLSFPWIESKVKNNNLSIHRWFFDIKAVELQSYSDDTQNFVKI